MPERTTTNATVPELGKTDGEQDDRGQEDIVVDLPYVELVARLISGKGVDAAPDTERMSPTLGLGVVVVQDIKAMADLIEVDLRDENRKPQPDNPPETNLDKVLVWLRQEFYRADPENTIEVGKNRTVQGVHGTPHIGGDTYPLKAAEPADENHALDEKPVRVGLIDTRVYRHENFRDRLKIVGRGELPPVKPFNHLDIHGTFTVGLILKQAPGAQVVLKAVLRHELAKATAWDVASAMADFIGLKVSLLVLPLVCFTEDGKPPLALQRAVTLLRRYGIPSIAAAGNHGKSVTPDGKPANAWPGFPAACEGAFAVGAGDAGGNYRADFNPHKDEGPLPWITLAGPGIGVESTSVDGEIAYVAIPGNRLPEDQHPVFEGGATWDGTSFATATVGGEIAAKLANGEGPVFEIIEKLQTQSPAGNDNHGVGGYGHLASPPASAAKPLN
jgi:membrane-anchored mycosin MYCP